MPDWRALEIMKSPQFPRQEKKTAWEEFQELYPVGAVVRTLTKVQDPLKEVDLPAGSFVTIKDVCTDQHQNKMCFSKAWILCEDQSKGLWNIRPHHLEKYRAPTGKKGRFRILAQDAEIENHNNKEKLCQKK
jgi:hypothetical protein